MGGYTRCMELWLGNAAATSFVRTVFFFALDLLVIGKIVCPEPYVCVCVLGDSHITLFPGLARCHVILGQGRTLFLGSMSR